MSSPLKTWTRVMSRIAASCALNVCRGEISRRAPGVYVDVDGSHTAGCGAENIQKHAQKWDQALSYTIREPLKDNDKSISSPRTCYRAVCAAAHQPVSAPRLCTRQHLQRRHGTLVSPGQHRLDLQRRGADLVREPGGCLKIVLRNTRIPSAQCFAREPINLHARPRTVPDTGSTIKMMPADVPTASRGWNEACLCEPAPEGRRPELCMRTGVAQEMALPSSSARDTSSEEAL